MNMLTGRAFHADWFWSPATARAAHAWLADVADEPIFVEQLYMYPFVPMPLRDRVILDTQNHEAARIEGIARSEGGLARRSVARLQTGAVNRYERDALRAAGRILAVSTEEADAFEEIAPGRVRVVPNGVDVSAIAALDAPSPSQSLLFLGSLSYSANRDAIRYFARDIAPFLVGSEATLTVVGSGRQGAVATVAASAPLPVTVAGYVPDVAGHFSTSRAMIVPLRHGAGTRLKILEALAWGLPVVTTSIGAAGLELENGTHALIADESSAFAASIERLLRDDALWMRLSRAGRELVEARYAWNSIGNVLNETAQEVVEELRSDAA
jgi:glycosyltransferase involved in cell wall biosynthesis